MEKGKSGEEKCANTLGAQSRHSSLVRYDAFTRLLSVLPFGPFKIKTRLPITETCHQVRLNSRVNLPTYFKVEAGTAKFDNHSKNLKWPRDVWVYLKSQWKPARRFIFKTGSNYMFPTKPEFSAQSMIKLGSNDQLSHPYTDMLNPNNPLQQSCGAEKETLPLPQMGQVNTSAQLAKYQEEKLQRKLHQSNF